MVDVQAQHGIASEACGIIRVVGVTYDLAIARIEKLDSIIESAYPKIQVFIFENACDLIVIETVRVVIFCIVFDENL
jgi:hypothetical protein